MFLRSQYSSPRKNRDLIHETFANTTSLCNPTLGGEQVSPANVGAIGGGFP